MKDIRQSTPFSQYMVNLGWEVEKLDNNFVYLRKFPLFGYFAKIPRPNMPLDLDKILEFKKSHKIFRLKISPFVDEKDKNYRVYQKQFLDAGFKIDNSPFNPTTNYLIDLTPEEDQLFNNFLEAKRRAVRRALKNKVIVRESDDIDSFIKIRQRQYLPVWFLVGGDMRKLWKNLYPKDACLLLAYPTIQNNSNNSSPQIHAIASICGNNKPLAGILLLFNNTVAYYWFASSLPIGKKLFAPTLLVWEAIKLSKKRGCTIFDFEGIYDERFPKAGASWKGFTKFKEGFGVKKVVYMENFYI